MLAVILMHELFDEMQPLRPVINKYIGKQQQDYLQTMYNIVTLGLASRTSDNRNSRNIITDDGDQVLSIFCGPGILHMGSYLDRG